MVRRTRLVLPATLLAVAIAAATPAAAQFETTQVSALGAPPLLLTKADFEWEDISPATPPATYNIYRRLPGDDFRCIVSNLTSNAWADDPALSGDPPAGEAYWYSVVADDEWGENLHGNQVAIGERCPCSGPPPITGPITSLDLEMVGNARNPMEMRPAPGDPSRMFIVRQEGVILVMHRGSILPTPFLDIQGPVQCCGEQGLLSMAFHPDYASNGRFFVYYTGPGGTAGFTIVEEFRVSADPDIADPTPVQIIYVLDQPFGNHNGGQIAFNPAEAATGAYLYIGLGDGGSGNDPLDSGQRLDTHLGKILRIDVDSDNFPADPDRNYGIPADNPFVGDPMALDEIWSYGWRNPWRFTFDRVTGDMYSGDVGQNRVEEVSVGLFADGGGENFGWKIMEGSTCRGNGNPCSSCASMAQCSSFTAPAYDWLQSSTSPRSGAAIGGYVYRGCRMPDLQGTYFFSDNDANFVYSFELSGGTASNVINWSDPPLSMMTQVAGCGVAGFGQDAKGRLYLTCEGNGDLWRIIPN